MTRFQSHFLVDFDFTQEMFESLLVFFVYFIYKIT